MMDSYGYLMDRAVECLGGGDQGSYLDGDRELQLYTSDADRADVDGLLARWGIDDGRPLVVLVPGGAFGESKWWPAGRFAELADRLTQEENCHVIISCAPTESERALSQAIGRGAQQAVYCLVDEDVTLAQLKELVRRCSLMVSNDTGPCHIAAAFGVPLVTLFGPTDPRWTATSYGGETRLRIDVDCSPCQAGECSRDHECMKGISVDDVFAAAKGRLQVESRQQANADVTAAVRRQGSYYRAVQESFVPLRDGQGFTHADYRNILRKAGLDTVAGVFAFDRGESLDKPGLVRRERLRVTIPGHSSDEVVLYVKRYGRPSVGQLLKRWFARDSQATGAYDFAAAMALGKVGIDVPRPIAVGWDGRGFSERRSYVIMEELPNAEALERLLPRWSQAKNECELLRDRKKLVEQLAALVRRLHGSGYCHRDLYLAHVFLSRDCDGVERLCLIDLHRVFHPALRRRRWRVKDLSQLYYSSRDYFTRAEIMRFLRGYLGCSRLSGEDKRFARAVYRKSLRIARHDHKKTRRQREGMSDTQQGKPVNSGGQVS